MFARTPVQSPAWRFFAIALIVVFGPILLFGLSRAGSLKLAFVLVSLAGLTGYAFGFRIGPRPFWGAVAVLFTGGVLFKLGSEAASTLKNLPNLPPSSATHPMTLMLALGFFGLISLALFRHSGILQYPAAPEGGQRPLFDRKPLFRSPTHNQKLAELSRVAAETRAELERPMSPAMEAEARSFGPSRQLNLKQRQRFGTIALCTTFFAQIALAITMSGQAAIFWPAVGLAGVAAILTYHSAEVILKTEDKLTRSMKAAGILIILTVVLFAADTRPAFWIAKIAALDLAATIVGGLLPVAAYALRKNR